MTSRLLALAALAACGDVVTGTPDASLPPDAPGSPVVYRASIAELPPITFGGDPFCNYTIVLKDIDLAIGVLPTGAANSGTSQNLNVEAVVQPCTLNPQPPSIAKYQFDSASVSPTGTIVTFRSDPNNKPQATLVVDMTRAGDVYMAALSYHRTDVAPPLDWLVTAQVMMAR